MKLRAKPRATFKQFVRYMHKTFKCKKRIVVRVGKTTEDVEHDPPLPMFGETYKKPYGFLILINEQDTLHVQKDTLIHEWAHCLVPWSEELEHSDRWGVTMARIYRKVYKDF